MMEDTTSWLNTKLSQVANATDDVERCQELESIELKLKNLPSQELKVTSQSFDLNKLFTILSSLQNRYDLKKISSILVILFSGLEPSQVYQQYSPALVDYISHPESSVKGMILKELNRIVSNSPEIFLNNVDLLDKIVSRIADDDVGVGKLGMEITKKIGSTINGAKMLYSGVLLRAIARLVSKKNEISFRVYEVVIDIAKSSKECLEASISSGLLDSLLNLLEDDDILLQLNAIEQITDLLMSEEGLDYVRSRGLMDELDKKITNASTDPLSNLLIPGLMKFFGVIAKSHPNEVFSKYPSVIYALFDVIETSDDIVLLMNALDTLGYIGSTIEGKYVLNEFKDDMSSTLKRMNEYIKTMPTELRLRALDNFAILLHVDKDKQNNQILSLTKSWFDLFDDEPLKVIFNLCKQPFADIKLSSLKIVFEISSQAWGQEYIEKYPGFVEFLLNRSSEAYKETKEIKHEIIKALLDSHSSVFDTTTCDKFKNYIKQGPFYVDLQMEVALENME